MAVILARGAALSRTAIVRSYWRDHQLLIGGVVVSSLVILVAGAGPHFAPYDPNALGSQTLATPGWVHLMGTDELGRDLFSRLLSAGQVSLSVACSAVTCAFVIGAVAGMIAGYRQGSWVDVIIMRLVDSIMSIPFIVLVIVVAGTLKAARLQLGPYHVPDVVILIGVLALGFFPSFARIAKAATLAEMQEDYVSAARAIGVGPVRILVSNLLPNVMPSLVIQASFSLALAVATEATVSFLGFGISPPTASWGNLLGGSRDYILIGYWWLVVPPLVIIVVAAFGFNLLGEGLRDVLDPKRISEVPGQ